MLKNRPWPTRWNAIANTTANNTLLGEGVSYFSSPEPSSNVAPIKKKKNLCSVQMASHNSWTYLSIQGHFPWILFSLLTHPSLLRSNIICSEQSLITPELQRIGFNIRSKSLSHLSSMCSLNALLPFWTVNFLRIGPELIHLCVLRVCR